MKKKWRILLPVILTCLTLIFLIFVYSNFLGRSPPEEADGTSAYFVRPKTELKNETSSELETEIGTATEAVAETAPYISPVDFEELAKVNADIYAWLDIPGTDISYPLLQHDSDDGYYHRRDMKGDYDINGSLYTEGSYNGRDFTDPLTIVYGHNMDDGSMFGTLQKNYSSKTDLAEKSEIVIYLPEREMHFTVFAAVPYDKRHILYNYDFSDRRTFRLFFDEILSIRAMEGVFAENASVTSGEQVLILSTCLAGNSQNRFLVCAKLAYSEPVEIEN